MLVSIITPTHKPQFLQAAWESIRAQELPSGVRIEWVVCPNPVAMRSEVVSLVDSFERPFGVTIRVVPLRVSGGIGAIKNAAFHHGLGDLLVELDHDDLLMPNAVEKLVEAAREYPLAGFFYSDWVDLDGKTYADNLLNWMASGWKFYPEPSVDPGLIPRSFAPSAAALSSILFAPNHVRAWRRETYLALGGHDPRLEVCDDHDLLIRTYLTTLMAQIRAPLYRHRIYAGNTWRQRQKDIDKKTQELYLANVEALVKREAELSGLPIYDLGAAIGGPAPGWIGVDIQEADGVDIGGVDLRQRWPWDDNSVFAFRANDFLEHLPDKQHTMSEVYRCLAPGGWLLSSTPSTDGRGAWMDPTHVSGWNSLSFRYWTHDEQAKYIGNTSMRFAQRWLLDYFPSPWHEENKVPYVAAHLIAMKPDYSGPRRF